MNGQLDAQQIFAFLQRDSDGTEGIIAMRLPDGWMPMVGIDLTKAESYTPLAQDIADATKRPVCLVKFGAREEVKVISPNRMSDASATVIDEKTGIVAIHGPKPKEEA